VLVQSWMARSPIAVFGYDAVPQAYLPDAPVDAQPRRMTDAIVVDSLAVRRGRDLGPFRRWLRQHRTSVTSTTIDRLRIFIARKR
jgi:hypothetical protein